MKKKEIITGSVFILVVIVIFLAFNHISSKSDKLGHEDIFIESETVKAGNENGQAKTIRVEIRGEIQNPGVYTLNNGSRVEDLIAKAGGFTEVADKDSMVSQARKLKDEERIVVKKKEIPNENGTIGVVNSGVTNKKETEDAKININTASKAELMKIPGVGEVTAQKIIVYREKHGDFRSVEELKEIDGIGDVKLSKMLDVIDAR